MTDIKPVPRQSRDPASTPPARENRLAQVRGERRRRKDLSINAHLRFSIPDHLRDDKNYRYHWAVDRPGRLENLTKHDDWDFVEEAEISGDSRQTGAGTPCERHAGVDKFGNPQRAFLLRKPRDYDAADQAAKQKRLDDRMTAIKRGKTPDESGNAIHNDGSYVPAGGISIKENYTP